MAQIGAAGFAGGQHGMVHKPSEALSQPALDPLLAAFSAQMGVGQVTRLALFLYILEDISIGPV